MTKSPEERFLVAMYRLCEITPKKCKGYNPVRFRQMLQSSNDGVETAKKLLNPEDPKSGFTELYMCDEQLQLSVEAFVLSPTFKELFLIEDREKATGHFIRMGCSDERIDEVVAKTEALISEYKL